tara:strand:- start:24186 stop:24326 length:141 start_codon:yes stop_codon:yes gene_type:complete
MRRKQIFTGFMQTSTRLRVDRIKERLQLSQDFLRRFNALLAAETRE